MCRWWASVWCVVRVLISVRGGTHEVVLALVPFPIGVAAVRIVYFFSSSINLQTPRQKEKDNEKSTPTPARNAWERRDARSFLVRVHAFFFSTLTFPDTTPRDCFSTTVELPFHASVHSTVHQPVLPD